MAAPLPLINCQLDFTPNEQQQYVRAWHLPESVSLTQIAIRLYSNH